MDTLEDISFTGAHLNRPECVLTHVSGLFFAPDWTDNGGVSITRQDGSSVLHLAKDPDFKLRPNGIALEPGGSFLLAHLGPATGGIYRLFPDGQLEQVHTSIDGEPIPPSNFVCVDSLGNIWFTVSTRVTPRADDYRRNSNTGFIAFAKPNEAAKIVADNLGYANECIIDEENAKLYVNETFAKRLTSFDLVKPAELSNKTVVAEFGHGTFPDGMAMDSEGHILVVSIVSNRLLRVSPEGDVKVLLEDTDPEHLEWVEQAWTSNLMDRPHLDIIKSSVLGNISSIAFYGKNYDRAALGCLLGDSIATLPLNVPGKPPVHWNFNISPLLEKFSS